MTEAVLAFREVAMRYRRRGRWVLEGTSFALASGELLYVRGANGSGKSTLIRLAAGFGRPTLGDIRRSVSRCGFVPDRVAPFPRITARTYFSQLAAMNGSGTGGASQAADLAVRFGLSPGLDTPLEALSRGNMRKVVLAQALARPVDIVIMDEPLVGLDAAATAEVVAVVAAKQAEGCAVLIATHSGAFAELGTTQELRQGRLEVVAHRQWIELRHPLLGYPGGEPTQAGMGYWVDTEEVQSFLAAALAADCGVLQVLAASERRGEVG